MDFVDRHAGPFLFALIAVVSVVVLIAVIFFPGPTEQERLQQRTHYITKTLPTGRVVPCVVLTNDFDDSISCEWSKK